MCPCRLQRLGSFVALMLTLGYYTRMCFMEYNQKEIKGFKPILHKNHCIKQMFLILGGKKPWQKKIIVFKTSFHKGKQVEILCIIPRRKAGSMDTSRFQLYMNNPILTGLIPKQMSFPSLEVFISKLYCHLPKDFGPGRK